MTPAVVVGHHQHPSIKTKKNKRMPLAKLIRLFEDHDHGNLSPSVQRALSSAEEALENQIDETLSWSLIEQEKSMSSDFDDASFASELNHLSAFQDSVSAELKALDDIWPDIPKSIIERGSIEELLPLIRKSMSGETTVGTENIIDDNSVHDDLVMLSEVLESSSFEGRNGAHLFVKSMVEALGQIALPDGKSSSILRTWLKEQQVARQEEEEAVTQGRRLVPILGCVSSVGKFVFMSSSSRLEAEYCIKARQQEPLHALPRQEKTSSLRKALHLCFALYVLAAAGGTAYYTTSSFYLSFFKL